MRNLTPKKDHVPATTAFHALHKRKGGEVVIAKSTGKPLSKHPLSPAQAHAQLGAVEGHEHHEPGY